MPASSSTTRIGAAMREPRRPSRASGVRARLTPISTRLLNCAPRRFPSTRKRTRPPEGGRRRAREIDAKSVDLDQGEEGDLGLRPVDVEPQVVARLAALTIRPNSSVEVTLCPLTCVMMSPSARPASAAGETSLTCTTKSPCTEGSMPAICRICERDLLHRDADLAVGVVGARLALLVVVGALRAALGERRRQRSCPCRRARRRA